MDKNYDIIIGGGGAIGLSCALALAHYGLSVLLLDKSDDSIKINPIFDGRNIALNNASVRFFDRLNIWDSLKSKVQPINDIIVSDGTLRHGASESYIHFDAHDIQHESFGYFALNPDIHNALIDNVRLQSNITLCYNTQITNIINNQDSVQIVDNNNKTYHAKLLIAADGKHSFIRNFCNIDTHTKDYKQTAIVLAVSHEKPHQGIAQEFFLPSGPFAILPLVGNHASLVWIESHATAKALLDAPEDVFLYELKRRFGDYLGDLNIISPKFSYPLMLQIAKEIISKRTILIGDAAHVIHPISGQGFNLGIRDIGYLSEIIQEHHYAGLDIGSDIALNVYKNMRHKDISLFGTMTTGLNWIFSNDNLMLQQSRRFGLRAVQKIPRLRNFFAQSASDGSINNLPSLLKAS